MSDNDEFRVPPDLTAQPFVCPNCGSSKCSRWAFISPVPFDDSDERAFSLWNVVQQTRTCGECGTAIPAHLAERWEGMTVEEAEEEWVRFYRDEPRGGPPAGKDWST